VLVQLHQAGGLATTDEAYQRGVTFLLKTQRTTVRGGALAQQTVSDVLRERFPHGKDQFISMRQRWPSRRWH